MKIYLLILTYTIKFNDADEGICDAGEGQHIINAYTSPEKPNALAAEFNPIMAFAEKNNIVFPVQPGNREIKKEFGFTLHDFDGGDFKLAIKEMELIA